MLHIKVLSIALVAFQLCDCAHRRHHDRRSVSDEFIGFRFVSEPRGLNALDCSFSISSSAKDTRIEWRRDGTPIQPDVYGNGSVRLSSGSAADDGVYQCAAHVRHGRTAWVYLSRKATVRTTARFSAHPASASVVAGSPTAFQCTLDGVSSPDSVKWFHNEKEIRDGAGGYSILPVTGSLEIGSAEKRHEGEYRCAVSHDGRVDRSPAGTLAVQPKGSVPVTADIYVVIAPRAGSVLEGETAVLECLSASGEGKVAVRWLKDSRPLALDARVRMVGVSSLSIGKATPADAGLYTCRMATSDDTTDRTVQLSVQTAPFITSAPEDMMASMNTDVELECVASGHPAPLVSWFKNGEAIVPSRYFVVEPTRLRILGVVAADCGVYQCLAENPAGNVQAAAQLIVGERDTFPVAAASGRPAQPGAPLGVRAISVGSRIVTLEWDPPVQKNGNILFYHVLYTEEGSQRERTVNGSSPLAMSGLQPSTKYSFRVAAVNEAGPGAYSDTLKLTTGKEQAVPGRVSGLRASPLGPQTIEIRWEPPSGGPDVLRYKLFYIREPAGTEKETQIIIQSTEYTLHGMDKFSEYRVRVEAEGEHGPGLSQEIKVRTLSDVPSSPPRDMQAESTSTTSVRISWQPPSDDELNGQLTGYRLKYKTKLRGSKGSTFVIDAGEKEYTITGLDPNTQYLVRMAVVNHNGTGPFSDWLPVSTPLQDKEEALLGAPRELRPQAGPDWIQLSWLPPADESVLVRGYQVGWGNNVPDVFTERVAANQHHHRITGLKSGRDYVVSLRGFNKQGQGFPIYETVRTLSAQTFASFGSGSSSVGSPVGVRAEAASATSIRVSWVDGDTDAFNTMYTVRYSTSADGAEHRFVNSTEPWVLVDGLRPATEYELAVRAAVPGGAVSPWSMAVRNRTLSSAPSSAPRDLTVLPAASGDPHAAAITWQPPKYANGEVEEYLIYYTERVSLPDKDWHMNYVSGDRLAHTVSSLLPKATYYFKIQARNEKGYGPLSPVQTYSPAGGAAAVNRGRSGGGEEEGKGIQDVIALVSANPLHASLVAAFALLLLLAIILIAVCILRRSSKKQPGYGGRKRSGQTGGDLWINHPGGSHTRQDFMGDGIGVSIGDMKHLTGAEVVESPPPRYQALHDVGYGMVQRIPGGGGPAQRRTPLRQSVSSYEDEQRRCLVQPPPPSASHHHMARKTSAMGAGGAGGGGSMYAASEESGGTLGRNYHQSSTSLEQRGQPRTPQVVYTGNGRHQPIAKIEFGDSPYGSSTGLASATPPLPVQAPPLQPPPLDGYRTLRGTPQTSNPLRSFTQLAPPPQVAVRPVVVAAGGKQLPVGRATAQPRVNMANVNNIYSPFSSCSQMSADDGKCGTQREMEEDITESTALNPSNSTEELNAQMENLDTMIDDLQALQHEFGVSN